MRILCTISKIGEYILDVLGYPSFSWRISSHVTHLDQLRVNENFDEW